MHSTHNCMSLFCNGEHEQAIEHMFFFKVHTQNVWKKPCGPHRQNNSNQVYNSRKDNQHAMFSLFHYVYLFVHVLEGHDLIFQCEILAGDYETTTKIPAECGRILCLMPQHGRLVKEVQYVPAIVLDERLHVRAMCMEARLFVFYRFKNVIYCDIMHEFLKNNRCHPKNNKNPTCAAIETPERTG